MVDVPAIEPVTLPEPSTNALPLDEVHTPPGVTSVSMVTDPIHTGTEPVIVPATATALTVTTAVAATEPQVLVTV